jgi:hypothetical protein
VTVEKNEAEGTRLDRKLIEMLNEIRVALPGVQVLMAFLLIAPLNAGWVRTTHAQHAVYAVALVAAAIASVLLIAPSSYHRLRFKRLLDEGLDNKREMLITNERLVVGGFAFLSISVLSALWVTLDYVFGWGVATLVVVGLMCGVGWFWYGLALTRRMRDPVHGPS